MYIGWNTPGRSKDSPGNGCPSVDCGGVGGVDLPTTVIVVIF
jgi:hypothetical protein